MYRCTATLLETWTPDFSSSEPSNPDWLRVTAGGKVLSNGLTAVDWSENPVQLVLCESCGFPGCASGGYAHVSFLNDTILITTPQITDPDDWEQTQYAASYFVEKFGSAAIPLSVWEEWRKAAPDLPLAASFPRTTAQTLADAWRMAPAPPTRVDTLGEIVPMLKSRLLATDTMNVATAIRHVTRLVEWLDGIGNGEIIGVLDAPGENITIETLYFDGPGEADWPAFAVQHDQLFLMLGRACMFVPVTAGPEKVSD